MIRYSWDALEAGIPERMDQRTDPNPFNPSSAPSNPKRDRAVELRRRVDKAWQDNQNAQARVEEALRIRTEAHEVFTKTLDDLTKAAGE